jgi:hypothetical protein
MSPKSNFQFKRDENPIHHPSSLVICVARENLAYVAKPCQQLYSMGDGNSYTYNIRLSPPSASTGRNINL